MIFPMDEAGAGFLPKQALPKQSAWKLKDLVQGLEVVRWRGGKSADITSVATDSRRVLPGALFVALKGTITNGNHYIEQAMARGAVAVLSQEPNAAITQVPCIEVKDAREALALIARRFYGNPDEGLNLIGVTGTNGKSTIVMLVRHFLKQRMIKAGALGTIVYDLGGRTVPANRTTPNALEFYAMLGEIKKAECKHVLLEVTSHGVDQKRIFGIIPQLAVFTNLSQDHMDYHGSMDAYFKSKESFFRGATGGCPKVAIINKDDPYGRRLIEGLPQSTKAITFAVNTVADYYASNILLNESGTAFTLYHKGLEYSFKSPLVGRYNVYNVLASVAIVTQMGFGVEDFRQALEHFEGVPGRLEKIDQGQAFSVFVDYAHTDDALKNMLASLKEVIRGRLLLVFGCGGSRDREKRPLMVQAAQAYADYMWITADNPRREKIESIFEDMQAGVTKPEIVTFEPDRRRAIDLALSAAKENDCVVIAGKGHETFQILEHTVIPFDDRQVVRELLKLKQLSPNPHV